MCRVARAVSSGRWTSRFERRYRALVVRDPTPLAPGEARETLETLLASEGVAAADSWCVDVLAQRRIDERRLCKLMFLLTRDKHPDRAVEYGRRTLALEPGDRTLARMLKQCERRVGGTSGMPEWVRLLAGGATDTDRTASADWQAAIDAGALHLVRGGDSQPRVVALETEGFRPHGRKDLPTWPFALPLEWDADPFDDPNWCFQLHAWRMIDDHILAHHRDGNGEPLVRALDIALDWLDWHRSNKLGAKASWTDMAVGLRAQKIAFLLSESARGGLRLDREERVALRVLWEAHAAFIATADNLAHTNHTLIDLHGLNALVRVWPDHPESERLRQFLRTEVRATWAAQFDAEGVHRENSPAYHGLGVNLLTVYERSNWYGPEFGLTELLEKARAAEQWMSMPDGRVVPVGDSNGAPDSGPNWSGPSFTNEELSRFELFSRSGYGIVRSPFDVPVEGSSFLHFMCAFSTPAHKHGDDLSVVWNERGGDILVDAGKYAYVGGDPFRGYAVKARAHNTVEVAGIPDPRATEDPYGDALGGVARLEWGFHLHGRIERRGLGVEHDRSLLFRPGEWLVIVDWLRAREERDFTQWFHFTPRVRLARTGKGLQGDLGGRCLWLRSRTSTSSRLELVRGVLKPEPQGWISRGYRKMDENDAIGISVTESQAVLATTVGIGEPAAGVTVSLDGDTASVDLEGAIGVRVELTRGGGVRELGR